MGQRIKVSSYGEEDKFLFEGDVIDCGWVIRWVSRETSETGESTGMGIGWYLERDNFESWSPVIIGEEYNVFGNIHDDPELSEKVREDFLNACKRR